MREYQIYYVGSQAETGHHAAPLQALAPVRIADPDEVQRLARPGDLAIFFSEHFHRFRNAWYQLHQRGCLTLYAIDGILEWRNAWENGVEEPACPSTMRPVLSDKAACIGAAQARILDAWGNRGKTEIVGLPRLDELLAAGPRPPSRIDAVSGRPLRILVTTAKWPGYTPEQVQRIRQSLRDLQAWSLRNLQLDGRSLSWTWRLTGSLAADIGVDNTLTSTDGEELVALLEQSDVVITTPSTVMLEAMASGLPVAILDYTNSPAYTPAAWQITAREQIDPVLARLAAPAAHRLAHQHGLLAEALQIGEPAAPRMIELCQAMIRHGHDCRQAGRPLEWPPRLLDPAAGHSVDASGATAAERLPAGPATAEVDALINENQRQLGVLQRRVELLESELARAAEGFSKIASHPILGPLLKVRQTALRFGNQIGQVLARPDEEGSPPPDLSAGANPSSEVVDE